jgi:hypothetical protein
MGDLATWRAAESALEEGTLRGRCLLGVVTVGTTVTVTVAVLRGRSALSQLLLTSQRWESATVGG